MAVAKQPGFDGAHFVEEPIRDFDGKGKRDLVRRVKYDVVERLYRYNPSLLSLEQRDAAVRLQCDDQLSNCPVAARVGTVGVSKNDMAHGLSEAVLDARGRVRRAEAYLGKQWGVVRWVVLNNANLGMTAKTLAIHPRKVIWELRRGLDSLTNFYERWAEA